MFRIVFLSLTLISSFLVSASNINEDNGLNYVSKVLSVGDILLTSEHTDSPSHEDVTKLIDGNVDSKFLALHKSSWILMESKSLQVLTHYELTSANDAPGRDPAKWILEGSIDGKRWQKIDERTAQTFNQRNQTREFIVKNDRPFKFYRFNFTQSHKTEYGDEYLQLAELSLFVKTKEPISNFTVSQNVIELNQTVNFKETSDNYPTAWFWTFENGTPSTSTEANPSVKFTKPGSHKVTLTTSNQFGESVKVIERAVKAFDPLEPWLGFSYPEVVLSHEDTQSAGYKRLNRLIPDIQKTINEISLKVNQKLYKNFTQVPEFDKVIFSLQWSDVLASRGGSGKTMVLTFSTKYITEQLANQPDEQVLYELEGVFWHELTHGYQYHPANGQYKHGTPYHAFIEGVADLIRIDAGYHKTRSPQPSANWLGGYTNTGFFLHWIKENYDADFSYKFNRSAIELSPWSFDKAIESIVGKPIRVLWDEYQKSLLLEKEDSVAKADEAIFLMRNWNVPHWPLEKLKTNG